jgi:hypothetical protein
MTKSFMTTFTLIISASLLSVASAAGAVELTESNFAEHMAGKNSIIKFLAPW